MPPGHPSYHLPTRRRVLKLLAGSAGFVALARGFAVPLPLGTDRDGQPVQTLAATDTRVCALLFLSTDCPVSNRYLPEIARLAAQFRSRGARFWLGYPNASDTLAAVRAHQASFADAAALDTLVAPDAQLIRAAGVHVTPEAALFRRPFSLDRPALWHGRIDNRYLSITTRRSAPTHRDLAEALEAALTGSVPLPPQGHAVGCAIVPPALSRAGSEPSPATGSAP